MPSDHSAPVSFSTWAITIGTTLASLFGISGILYATGFLILRAHYSFLGIWGTGIPDATILTEEGGRFFYHLVFIPVKAIASIASHDLKILWVLLLLIFLLLLGFELFRRGYKQWGSTIMVRAKKWIESMPGVFITMILLIVLLLMAIILETVWLLTEPTDVLRYPEQLKLFIIDDRELTDPREHAYLQIVWRVAFVLIIGWLSYYILWARSERFNKLLIMAEWVLIVAAIEMVPVAYGKFVLETDYPTVINKKTDIKDTLLLVGQTSDSWVIWNATQKQTEILPRTRDDQIIIGSRQSLLSFGSGE